MTLGCVKLTVKGDQGRWEKGLFFHQNWNRGCVLEVKLRLGAGLWFCSQGSAAASFISSHPLVNRGMVKQTKHGVSKELLMLPGHLVWKGGFLFLFTTQVFRVSIFALLCLCDDSSCQRHKLRSQASNRARCLRARVKVRPVSWCAFGHLYGTNEWQRTFVRERQGSHWPWGYGLGLG